VAETTLNGGLEVVLATPLGSMGVAEPPLGALQPPQFFFSSFLFLFFKNNN
jgi:hypothetical protein